MKQPQTIKIDDVEYIRVDCIQKENNSGPKDIKIVILPRGWNFVGEFNVQNEYCILKNASVIRKWGTTKGLGQIAKNGPTCNTVLDKCNGKVTILKSNIIVTIDCECSKW